jgi:hypothetical protein
MAMAPGPRRVRRRTQGRREQDAGDETQQDDDGHQQTPNSPELFVVHYARRQLLANAAIAPSRTSQCFEDLIGPIEKSTLVIVAI